MKEKLCENMHNAYPHMESPAMSESDPLQKWQHRIDCQLDGIEDSVRNHPGFGKPLKLNNDSHVPKEMQMAYKILADNDMVPDWIATGKALEKKEQQILQALKHAAKDYQSRRFANAVEVWESEVRKLRVQVKAFNSEVLSFNLKLPNGITHRRMLNLDLEIQRELGK
jgi:hypothetical protein